VSDQSAMYDPALAPNVTDEKKDVKRGNDIFKK
jgi:hypothetical protein